MKRAVYLKQHIPIIQILLIGITAFGVLANTGWTETVLGIDGSRFTVNGEPTFLLGVSYYSALGASKENIQLDLNEMKPYGFNWIRVWSTWAAFDHEISAVDPETGRSRPEYLEKLRWLVEECDKRSMIVDVTISRGNGVTGGPRLQTEDELNQAVRTLVRELKPYKNWYLDMGNERNINDKRFVSYEELTKLQRYVQILDPSRLVTASFAGDMKRGDFDAYLRDVKVDFLAPHRPRRASSPKETLEITTQYIDWMKESKQYVPLHYQEPFRLGYTPDQYNPSVEDYLTDLKNARESGAAGWCFHNGDQRDASDGQPRRSFDMRERRMFEQLDEVEKGFLARIKEAMED